MTSGLTIWGFLSTTVWIKGATSVFFNIDLGATLTLYSSSLETRSIIFLRSAGDLATGCAIYSATTGIYVVEGIATNLNLSIIANCSRVSYLAFDFFNLV